LRVFVADDELAIREAYAQVFGETELRADLDAIQNLRARLFNRNASTAAPGARRPTFEAMLCSNAIEAVAAATTAVATGSPYAVVFLDMRMPPGEDGAWVAARIRELDPDIEIVICTAYSEVDPANIGGMVPPQEKISFLQKPVRIGQHEIYMTPSIGIAISPAAGSDAATLLRRVAERAEMGRTGRLRELTAD
jgi:CheY-like chemotaxis protein